MLSNLLLNDPTRSSLTALYLSREITDSNWKLFCCPSGAPHHLMIIEEKSEGVSYLIKLLLK